MKQIPKIPLQGIWKLACCKGISGTYFHFGSYQDYECPRMAVVTKCIDKSTDLTNYWNMNRCLKVDKCWTCFHIDVI